MAKKKLESMADGTPTFHCLSHGGTRKGAGRKPKRHRDGSRVEPSHAICLLGTHIHLNCEADGPVELANGMRSVNGTIARALNERLHRKGAVFAHRVDLAGSSERSRAVEAARTGDNRAWVISRSMARLAPRRPSFDRVDVENWGSFSPGMRACGWRSS